MTDDTRGNDSVTRRSVLRTAATVGAASAVGTGDGREPVGRATGDEPEHGRSQAAVRPGMVDDAPILTVENASVAVAEGETATNTGAYLDMQTDPVTVSADVGRVTADGGTWTWRYRTGDGPEDSRTVTVTATDVDGNTAAVSFALAVANAAPVVAADRASVTVVEGESATNTGTYADPGGDAVSLSASVGAVWAGAGGWTWVMPTDDGPDDGGPVRITAVDEEGARGAVEFDLRVVNAAPSVTVDDGTVSVTEGDVATTTGSYADPGTDEVSLSASVGTVSPAEAGAFTWSFATTDGPAESGPVTIEATDDDGATGRATFDLEVANAPPSVRMDLDDRGVVGRPVSLEVAISDPGTGDSHVATVDWGDGARSSVDVDRGADTATASHIYTTGGRHRVGVTVTDGDGGTASAADTVVVTHRLDVTVKPGDDGPAPINPRSEGVVPVAIERVDGGGRIDVSTLRFGAPDLVTAGGGATPAHGGHREVVDGDRVLVVHFGGDTGFEAGDRRALVVGETTAGVALRGTDAVRVVGE